MKVLIIIIAVVLVLVMGGGITSNLLNTDFAVRQTSSPEASFFEATPDQAAWFFVLIGFILFNVIGIGVTVMLVLWFLDRSVKSVQASGTGAASE